VVSVVVTGRGSFPCVVVEGEGIKKGGPGDRAALRDGESVDRRVVLKGLLSVRWEGREGRERRHWAHWRRGGRRRRGWGSWRGWGDARRHWRSWWDWGERREKGDSAAESGEEFGEAGGAAGVLVETREDGGGARGVHVGSGGEFCGGEVTAVILVEFFEAFGAFLDDFGAEGLLSGGAFGVAEFAIAVGVEGVGGFGAVGGGVFHGLDEGLAFFDGEFAVFVEVVGFEDLGEFTGTEGLALGRGGGLGEGGGDRCGEDGREEGWFEEFHEMGGIGAIGVGEEDG